MAILINLKTAGGGCHGCLHSESHNWWDFVDLFLTVAAVVVHQDYLFEKVGRRPVDGGVNGPQDHRQGFIHKNEHNAHLREVQRISDVSAPARETRSVCRSALKSMFTPGFIGGINRYIRHWFRAKWGVELHNWKDAVAALQSRKGSQRYILIGQVALLFK